MKSFQGRYMARGNDKAEMQKIFNDIMKDMGSEDMITISLERKADQEAMIQELTRQGIII